MLLLQWLAGLVGLLLVLVTADSLIRTLVVPRGYPSKLSIFVGRRFVRGLFLWIASHLKTYDAKDRVLALTAPIALLATFLTWLVSFLIGYGLLLWAFVDIDIESALREAGSSMLTLGFASTAVPAATVIDLFAGATGFIAIALEIAYLPVLYGAYNRRETLVTTLQSRAGSPAWGPEILARHQIVNILDNLPAFYGEWEAWAADVAESHSNYTVLIWFRSPHPLRSWVLALLAVLDSAALYLALSPSRAPSEARLCLRMGFTCLRDIAQTLAIPFDPDPFPSDPINLSFEEFTRAVERLRDVDFPVERSADEAWPHFRGWRVNYESLAYTLADSVVAAPGPWSGARRALPGLVVEPERPPNRRPGEHEGDVRPKGYTGY